MELKNLIPIVTTFLLIGLLLGVGLIVFDAFGTAAKSRQTITNETVTFTSGATQLQHYPVFGISYVWNATKTLHSSEYNWTSDGRIVTNVSIAKPFNVTYAGSRNTTATGTMGSMVNATSPISTTWLPLIITIAILAIVLFLVIRSFNRGR